MRGNGTNPLDLVSRDGHPQSGAADQQRPVAFAGCDELGGGGGNVWVGGLVIGTDVDDRDYAGIGSEVGLDFVLVGYAGVLERDHRLVHGLEKRLERTRGGGG